MKFRCSYTEAVEIHKLQPNPKNPNKHPEKQIDRLAEIIDYQGQRSPIIVSKRSGFIVKGHGRLEAIKKLGWKKAAVDYQDYENEAQEYADIVADNAIAEWAELDISQINQDFTDLGPDLDLEMLGLKQFTLDPLEDIDMDDSKSDDGPKKFILEVQLPGELELRDLYDDLISKGYMVKEK